MSTNTTETQDSTAPDQTTLDARPSDCACSPTFTLLPCFACHSEGFETPNPNVEDTE